MHNVTAAARRHAASGLALVGAAAIVASPIAPHPDVHLPVLPAPSLSAAQVELAAMANPLQQWAEVITTALANAEQLRAQLGADPAPILRQVVANQLANAAVLGHVTQTTMAAVNDSLAGLPSTLQTAGGQLADGDVTGAAQTVLGAVLPLALTLVDGFNAAWPVAANTAQNLANVVAVVPQLVLPALLAVSAPVISLVNAGAATTQEVVDAVGKGDLGGLTGALLNAPAVLTGAVLNGYGTSPLGLPSAGLLSPVGDLGALTAGTVWGLLDLRGIVTSALHALPAPAAAVTTTTVSTPADLPSAEPARSVTVAVHEPETVAPPKESTEESHKPDSRPATPTKDDDATSTTDDATAAHETRPAHQARRTHASKPETGTTEEHSTPKPDKADNKSSGRAETKPSQHVEHEPSDSKPDNKPSDSKSSDD
ncbi:hypothetical protein [Mycolicibacterium phlei]